ncbi:MAG: phosphotransferase family protein [Pseudomonadales bacterium]
MTGTDQTIDANALQDWLSEQVGEQQEIQLTPIRGGGSCEMFELLWGTDRWVVRRAPLNAVSDTAHNVVREYKVIEALQNSSVRVPSLLAVSDDSSIIGAPFYIMQFIDGEVIRRRLPRRYLESPAWQTAIGEQLIDALVELHDFEWRGTAIEKLAKPDNFLHRQVDRWMGQLGSYRHRDLADVDLLAKWLSDNRPKSCDLTVMHGDYKVDNAMYSKDLPPAILALVDFEMTTVGAPLIDLAWAMIFWPEEGNLIAIAAPGSEGGMDADYCQSPKQLVQRYHDRTSRDISDFQWYQVFSAWKLAIVLEASYAKFVKGESRNPNHEFFGFLVDQLLERAKRFAV